MYFCVLAGMRRIKLYAALSIGTVVSLENTWKEKLHKSVIHKYISAYIASRVCGVGFEYCHGCLKETLQMVSFTCLACVQVQNDQIAKGLFLM